MKYAWQLNLINTRVSSDRRSGEDATYEGEEGEGDGSSEEEDLAADENAKGGYHQWGELQATLLQNISKLSSYTNAVRTRT